MRFSVGRSKISLLKMIFCQKVTNYLHVRLVKRSPSSSLTLSKESGPIRCTWSRELKVSGFG
ncbi:MAG: hypothetical protein N2235_09815 [Fischerella sp.]|nr:hypothetical protein [Fischerella sp.]